MEFESCIGEEEMVNSRIKEQPLRFLTYLNVWLDPGPGAVHIMAMWPLGLGEVILNDRGHFFGNLILAISARTHFVLKCNSKT